MKPQSNPVTGFYPNDNLRIMPENSNCSSLVDDEAVEVQVWRRVREGSPDGAVDGQCWIETLSGLVRRELKTRIKKKEVAHLLRHQRSKNDPGGGKPLAPSQLYIASSIGAIYARCPLHVCSKLHNLEISRDHERGSRSLP